MARHPLTPLTGQPRNWHCDSPAIVGWPSIKAATACSLTERGWRPSTSVTASRSPSAIPTMERRCASRSPLPPERDRYLPIRHEARGIRRRVPPGPSPPRRSPSPRANRRSRSPSNFPPHRRPNESPRHRRHRRRSSGRPGQSGWHRRAHPRPLPRCHRTHQHRHHHRVRHHRPLRRRRPPSYPRRRHQLRPRARNSPRAGAWWSG